jgi:hypothetical protein
VAQGRALLVKLNGAHLLVQEARAVGLVVIKELLLELEEDIVDAVGGLPILSIDLSIELPGEEADGVHELEVPVLGLHTSHIFLFYTKLRQLSIIPSSARAPASSSFCFRHFLVSTSFWSFRSYLLRFRYRTKVIA